MKNRKTTLVGVITILLVTLHIFYPEIVTSDVTLKVTALLVSLGLVAAQDSSKPKID